MRREFGGVHRGGEGGGQAHPGGEKQLDLRGLAAGHGGELPVDFLRRALIGTVGGDEQDDAREDAGNQERQGQPAVDGGCGSRGRCGGAAGEHGVKDQGRDADERESLDGTEPGDLARVGHEEPEREVRERDPREPQGRVDQCDSQGTGQLHRFASKAKVGRVYSRRRRTP